MNSHPTRIRFRPWPRPTSSTRSAPRWAPTGAPSPASAPTTSPPTSSRAVVERTASTPSGSPTSTSAPPTSPARTTATSPGWRRCSPACPHSVPGATVNRLCASGLEAVNTAARAVKLGEGDFYLAGGVESMSRAPWVVEKPERALPRGPQTMHDTTLGWRMINPRMAELGLSTESMGETGENVAERYGVSREDQDAFALRSHQRAVAAAEAGASPRRSSRSRRRRSRDRHRRRRRGAARPTPRWRSSPSCARSSARAAPSPPVMPRPSTTAPPAS